jgi:hypothetical protein
MHRPFFKASVDELEALLRKHQSDRFVLAQLREELGFRRTDRAKQLLREVTGLLSGQVPTRPKLPRAAQPEDQFDLIKPV